MQKSPVNRSRSSTPHYQTFPTKPPSGRGRPPQASSPRSTDSLLTGDSSGRRSSRSRERDGEESEEQGSSHPPYKQLAILAVISLAEQTALNSIAPYLPEMTATFPEVKREQVGVYVGVIASSFAAAQLLSNYLWGKLSDRIGRKPVILSGTFLTAGCFVAFGYCRRLWQAVLVQALMGAVNGNQAVVSTVLGEITNKSNQLEAFSWLPVVYGVGSIIGPMLGGLLSGVSQNNQYPLLSKYPYFLPNIIAAGLLYIDLAFVMYFLEESLQQAQDLPPLPQRFRNIFVRFWRFTVSIFTEETERSESNATHSHNEQSSSGSPEPLLPPSAIPLSYRSLVKTPVLLLLVSYLIFNLSNITFISLYPIFVSEPPPTGRDFAPKAIGLTLGIGGLAAILFQVLLFTRLQHTIGNKRSYVIGFLGMALAFFLMPLTSTPPQTNSLLPLSLQKEKNAMLWTYIQATAVLLLRSVASVAGLTCAMIMITNSSPHKATLGRINGLAQSLSAGGRAVGPFLSGGLWSATLKLARKRNIRIPEMLPWGVFGSLTVIGALFALGISSGTIEGDPTGGSEGGQSASGQIVETHERHNEEINGTEGRNAFRTWKGTQHNERASLLPQ